MGLEVAPGRHRKWGSAGMCLGRAKGCGMAEGHAFPTHWWHNGQYHEWPCTSYQDEQFYLHKPPELQPVPEDLKKNWRRIID